MNLPFLSPAQAELFFLVFIRVGAIVMMLPILGDRTTPARIKAGLSLLITFLVIPSLEKPAGITEDLFTLGMKMGGELLVGVILGFAGRLVFEGIQMAGQLVGFQMGFAIVNIIDPITSEQVSIISELQYLLAGLLFLAVNGHHLFLHAVSESYSVVPVLGFHLTGALMQGLVDLTREMFVISMKISAPIIVALVFANIGLGLVARTVPQINIFVVGFPLQIAIGLIGIGLTAPVFLHVATGLFSGLTGQISMLLKAM
jgi:flagellar biosynthesis protein FliR